MSERKLREWAESGGGTIVLCNSDAACADCQRLYEALAADPDVVKIVRHVAKKAKGDPAMRTGYGEMLLWLLGEFHVRLTDKGWEWTDE